MRTWTVYALVDPRTGPVRYVGWSFNVRARLNAHCRTAKAGGSHKANWIRQLLAAGLRPIVITLETGCGDWTEAERRWIAMYRSCGAALTNSTDGGEGAPGFFPGPATREKMSRAHAGRKQTPESIAKTRAALLGRKQSAEHVAALAALRKGKVPLAAVTAAAKYWRGRKQAADHVARRIAAHIGRQRPELHRLTDAQVREIRAARGVVSLRKLAAIHRVGQTTIFEVQRRTAYAHVP